MTKRSNPTVQVVVEHADNVIVLRDGIHVEGDAVSVEVRDLTNSKIGGDLVNVTPDRRQRRARSKPVQRPVRRAIVHGVAAIFSVTTMVAASGIAFAMGWG